MQKKMLVLAMVAATSLLAACNGKGTGSSNTALTTDNQKFGYSLGLEIGQQLQHIKDNVDLDSVKAGIDDAVAGRTPKLDDATRQAIRVSMGQKIMAQQMADMQKKAEGAKSAGEKFLAENAKKAGVKTTASGLQYEVIKEGTGAHPSATDTVTVNYRGTLLNGTEFDSSYARNEPATFPLNGVIPGWTEGLQLMTPGSKYKLYVPAKLAYGDQGAGGKIGPGETLVFEVELLSIKK